MSTYVLRVIKPDGSDRLIETDKHPRMEQLRDIIGGWIEHHAVSVGLHSPKKTMDMLMDEEGLLKGLPINKEASVMAGYEIVGTVIVYEKGRFQ